MARPRATAGVGPSLSSGDHAVLALVAERPTHGWAIATQFARGGDVGSIWSLGRPLVYQALERLEKAALIKTIRIERGERGPHRVLFAATPAGRRLIGEWLASPVEHVRDIRSLFLLKVVLSQRAGIDVEPLLVAQRAVIVPFAVWVEAQLDDADRTVPAEVTALYFRLETAHMVVRFIDGMLDELARKLPPKPEPKPGPMKA